MYRRVVCLITLVCFLVFLAGCTSVRPATLTEVRTTPDHRIQSVVTKDGAVHEFKTHPERGATLEGDVIVGQLRDGGIQYIPIEDADTVYIIYTDPVKSTFGCIGIAVAVAGVLLIIAMATKESCPFIYSFDGEQFVFDGEPYGGAICPALQRTDLCQLEYLRPQEGKYLLRLANEVDETQYTDELRLWVVDHPPGTLAIPDAAGQMHTVSRPMGLLAAREGSGRDVSLWLTEKDPRVWESDVRNKNPEVTADLRDTLFLTFPRPSDAPRAKLVVNACNSLWASHMLRRLLELQGSGVEEMLQKLEAPDTRANLEEFFYREELFFLKVRVWVGGEWVERGRIMGGGPFVSEDRVVMLDLEGVEGDELRIQLTPPTGFWRFDWFAADYSDDAAISLLEVAASSAVGDDGEDLRAVLDTEDGGYHVMPEVGQGAVLEFSVPPREGNEQRTVFAKVSGYYDIHLAESGPPQTAAFGRILLEPGYMAEYSLREYQDWRQHQLAGSEQ